VFFSLFLILLAAAFLIFLHPKQWFRLAVGVFLVWLAALCLSRSLPDLPGEWRTDQENLLFLERASNPVSGVSPVLRIVWLALGFYCLVYYQLKRWELLPFAEGAKPYPPKAEDGSLKGLADSREQVNAFLRFPGERILGTRRGPVLIVLVGWLFLFCRVYGKLIPTVEGFSMTASSCSRWPGSPCS
jgi:hypothetical protein